MRRTGLLSAGVDPNLTHIRINPKGSMAPG
jgi:hypothetical protein